MKGPSSHLSRGWQHCPFIYKLLVKALVTLRSSAFRWLQRATDTSRGKGILDIEVVLPTGIFV